MSQIGKKIINIPEKVSVDIDSNNIFNATGPLGKLSYTLSDLVKLSINDNIIQITRLEEDKKSKEMHGLTRSLIYNIIQGVSEGFSKELNLIGVGYTADSSNKDFLLLNLGFSHPIFFQKPDSIDFETPDNTTIIVKGINKQEVGEVAAKIRSLRKPEPYKGKGVKYANEHIRRKAGKTVGA